MKKFFEKVVLLLLMILLPSPAFAALQYVGGVTGSRAGSTSAGITLSLTALTGGISSTAATGDIVIVSVASGGTSHLNQGVSTSGYKELNDLYANGSSNDAMLSVNWKIMGATPDTSVVTLPSGSTADGLAAAAQVWRNVDQVTPLDVASTSSSGTATGRPTPPAITPVTSGAVVIATGSGAAATGAVFTTATLSNFLSVSGADTIDGTVGMGSFAWTSGTYTPAQFTGGTTGSGDSWAGLTLVLRPSQNPPTLTTDAATGVGNTSGILNGTISDIGTANPTTRGFAWGTDPNLSGGDTSTSTESGSFSTGSFTSPLINLVSNTKYYYRAYAVNTTGTGYGSIQSLTTSTNITPSRIFRLFEGYVLKLYKGARLIIHQQ